MIAGSGSSASTATGECSCEPVSQASTARFSIGTTSHGNKPISTQPPASMAMANCIERAASCPDATGCCRGCPRNTVP